MRTTPAPQPRCLRCPRRTDPIELELLFKFEDGFAARVPALVRSEFAAAV